MSERSVCKARGGLRKAVGNLIGAARWCSGATDFHPEGQARQGYESVVLAAIEEVEAALAAKE